MDRGSEQIGKTATVSVDLKELGLSGTIRGRDLRSHTNLGTFSDSFGQELPIHGAGFYRLFSIQ